MKLKNFIWSILLVSILSLLTFTSCEPNNGDIDDVSGLPATISMQFVMPAPASVEITKASDDKETAIKRLALLMYQSESSRPVVVESATYELERKVSSTDFIYTVKFDDEAIRSGDWYLYAIANYHLENFGSLSISEIKGMTKAEMDNYIVKKQNDYVDFIDDALLLTGKYGDTGFIHLKGGDNDFSNSEDRVHLRRITAKINFKIQTASGVSFVPETYTIYNYSQSSTLFERRGWTQEGSSSENYKYGTFPGTLEYAGASNASDRFITATDFIYNNQFTFYMMENVQKPSQSFTDYNYREKRNTESDPTSRDFKYAPKDGTYVVISGYYTGPGAKYDESSKTYVVDNTNKVSGRVDYTVHLGNLSEGKTNKNTKGSNDNFTVRRNTKYSYVLSISGVKNIIVEAETDTENNSGAEGHLVSSASGTANLVLDAHYETVLLKFPAAKIDGYALRSNTPYESETYTSTDATADKPVDVNWIKFAKPATTASFEAYPGTGDSALTDIYGLMEELVASGGTKSGNHFLYDNGYIYVTAFVDEYYYTKKPGSQENAALAEFINKEDRELSVTTGFAISSDKHSTYASGNLFTIRQTSIKSMYNLSVANPLGIETYEEYTTKVDRGTIGSASDSENHGWGNYTANMSLGTASWSTYVQPSAEGHFENTNVMSANAWTSSGRVAAYQCLSRNRDENGNGKIDREEVKWYLPSHNECLVIWNGFYALNDAARVNEDDGSGYTVHHSSTGNKGMIWWHDEGAAFGGQDLDAWVRCVRTLKNYDEAPTSDSILEGNVITIVNLGDNATRANGKKGEYTSSHYRNDAADKLPESFKVANANLAFKAVTEYTLDAPHVSNITVADNKLSFTISNYSDINDCNIYYTLQGSENATAINSSSVSNLDISSSEWTTDSKGNQTTTVTLYLKKTIASVLRTSNTTIIRVTRKPGEEVSYSYAVSVNNSGRTSTAQWYPYVEANVNTQGNVTFGVKNYDKISGTAYSREFSIGTSVSNKNQTNYPYVNQNTTTITGAKLTVTLDNQNNSYFKYKVNTGSENSITGKTFEVDFSSLNDGTHSVVVYSTYSSTTGKKTNYNQDIYKSTIKVTKTSKNGKAYYKINSGTAVEIPSASDITIGESSLFSGSATTATVTVYSDNDETKTSVITVTKTASSSYTFDDPYYVNGRSSVVKVESSSTTQTFTKAEIIGSSYCEQYYYENEDKSDLGYWRIPNERELGLMFKYDATFNLSTYTCSRTGYNRSGSPQPYYIQPTRFITTAAESHDGEYVIRCVRDNQ